MKPVLTAALIVAMASCSRPEAPSANDNDAPAGEPAAPPRAPPEPDGFVSNASAPPARTAVDDKGVAGAVRVLERYGASLEERHFAEARSLWSDDGRASGLTEAEFVAAYDKFAEIHAEVGSPGDSEGAAGSIYVDVPLRLHGTLTTGMPFNLVGPVSLRRVNDVPGSTAEQRRWHIFQSGLKPRP